MTAVSSIVIEIKALAGQFTEAMAGVNEKFNRLNNYINEENALLERSGKLLERLMTYAAAYVGFEKIRESIHNAEDLEEALAKLNATLRGTGQFTAPAQDALASLAETQMHLTGVHKDQILNMETTLLSLHATVAQTKELIPILLDYSAAFGEGPNQLAKSLGEIIQGDTAALRSFGLTAKTAPKDFEGLINLLKHGPMGAAEQAYKAKGPLGAMETGLYELSAAAGELILKLSNSSFADFARKIDAIAQALERFPKHHPVWVDAFKVFLAVVTKLLIPLTAALVTLLAFKGGYAIFTRLAYLINVMGNEAAIAAVKLGAANTAALALGSAISGWQMGKFIGQLKAGSKSINDWTAEIFAVWQGWWQSLVAYVVWGWNSTRDYFRRGFYDLEAIVRSGVLEIVTEWNKLPFGKKIDTRPMEAGLREALARSRSLAQENNDQILRDKLAAIDKATTQVVGRLDEQGKAINHKHGAGGFAPEAVPAPDKGAADADKLFKKIHDAFLQTSGAQKELLNESYQDALVTLDKTLKGDKRYEEARLELRKTYLLKLAALERKEADLEAENQRAALTGRIKAIQENPHVTDAEKVRQQIPLQQQLLALGKQRAQTLQKLASDPATSDEARLAAQKQLVQLKEQEAELENQIGANAGRNSLAYQFQSAFVKIQNAGGSVAQQVAGIWVSTFNKATDSISSNFTKLIEGTKKWKEAILSIGSDVVNQLVQGFVHMAVQWTLQEAVMVAAHAAGEEAQTGATAAGSTQRGSIRLAETIFHGVLVAVRLAAHLAGEIGATLITATYAALRAMYHAIVAAVAAMESEASVPYVGVALGIAAAATMMAAAMALMGGFAEGGYTGDGPWNQIAGVVHRGEYVIPAARVNTSTLPMLQAIHSGALADAATPRAPILPTVGSHDNGSRSDQPINQKFIMVANLKEAALEAMASPAGEKVTVVHIRNNRMAVGIKT